MNYGLRSTTFYRPRKLRSDVRRPESVFGAPGGLPLTKMMGVFGGEPRQAGGGWLIRFSYMRVNGALLHVGNEEGAFRFGIDKVRAGSEEVQVGVDEGIDQRAQLAHGRIVG